MRGRMVNDLVAGQNRPPLCNSALCSGFLGPIPCYSCYSRLFRVGRARGQGPSPGPSCASYPIKRCRKAPPDAGFLRNNTRMAGCGDARVRASPLRSLPYSMGLARWLPCRYPIFLIYSRAEARDLRARCIRKCHASSLQKAKKSAQVLINLRTEPRGLRARTRVACTLP